MKSNDNTAKGSKNSDTVKSEERQLPSLQAYLDKRSKYAISGWKVFVYLLRKGSAD